MLPSLKTEEVAADDRLLKTERTASAHFRQTVGRYNVLKIERVTNACHGIMGQCNNWIDFQLSTYL